VFTWVLHRLAAAGLVKGKTIGIDATTLETGEPYDEFLTRLAHASGIETPTRETWRASIASGRTRGRTATGRIRMIPTPKSRR
jgi:hypothetical protein